MTLYNGSIGQLVQGISQQNPKDRAEGQLGAQVNCVSDVVEGLRRRPGWENVATLPDLTTDFTFDEKTAVYFYERGDGVEEYLVLIDTDGVIKVYDTDGVSRDVLNTAVSYVDGGSPIDRLRFHTIGDTTFVLNTEAPVSMEQNLFFPGGGGFIARRSPALEKTALVYVKKANYGREYEIVIDGTTRASTTTPSTVTLTAGQVSKTLTLQTEDIATTLGAQLVAWGGADDIQVKGDTIYIEMPAEFNIEIIDGSHGNDIVAIKHTVDGVEDLPRLAPDDYRVLVKGKDDEAENDFWLQFKSDNISSTVYGNNLLTGFDASMDGPTTNWSLLPGTAFPAASLTVTSGASVSATIPSGQQSGTYFGLMTPTLSLELGKTYQVEFDVGLGNATDGWDTGTLLYFGSAVSFLPQSVLGQPGTIAWMPTTLGGTVSGTFTVTDAMHDVFVLEVHTPIGTTPVLSGIYVSEASIKENISTEWGGPGEWDEVVAPSQELYFWNVTMPHILTRESDGTFTFSAAEWEPRAAGDADSNPNPSFVGQPISDITSYQNRLVLLAGENVIASQADNRFNFFAESVAQAADDDPIDSESSAGQVTKLKNAVLFDKSLVVLADGFQFIHPGDVALKPGTFAVQADSAFRTDIDIPPVTTGNEILMAAQLGDYTQLLEYRVNDISGRARADSITKHIPKFIKGKAIQLVSNTAADYTFILTDDLDSEGKRKDIYVLQYYYHGGERRQLAWHKWNLPETSDGHIRRIAQIRDQLYAFIEYDSGVELEKVDLSQQESTRSTIELCLDRYQAELVETGPFTVGLREWATRFVDTLDSAPSVDAIHDVLIEGEGSTNPNMPLQVYDRPDDGYIYSNMPAGSYILKGRAYKSSGELTLPYVRDGQGRAVDMFDLILDEMRFAVSNTGYLDILVSRAVGEEYRQVFNGIILNDYRTLLGEQNLFTVNIDVPIQELRDMLTVSFESESHLPFAIQSVDWVGNFNGRGRRST